MKALSYLEISVLYNKRSTREQLKEYFEICKYFAGEGNILDFYTQPFTPELICKYFEGWEVVEYVRWRRYVNPNDDRREFQIDFWDNPHELFCLQARAKGKQYEFIKPQTLDDFIRDCQRAGIELYFKKQEANNE